MCVRSKSEAEEFGAAWRPGAARSGAVAAAVAAAAAAAELSVTIPDL